MGDGKRKGAKIGAEMGANKRGARGGCKIVLQK